ncbi:MAG: acyl-CoA dehydrogenase family protein [Acidimicrobiales bacterium]
MGASPGRPRVDGCGLPKEHGGRGLNLHQQVIWFEEYARARGPGRLGHIGEGLTGPTVMAYGNTHQQQRFLLPIVAGAEPWAQGYSEPGAGSDLANVATRAEADGDDFRLTGQKVGTSWPTGRTGCSCWPAPIPMPARGTGDLPTSCCPWARTASTSARSASSPVPASSTRCSSTARLPSAPM